MPDYPLTKADHAPTHDNEVGSEQADAELIEEDLLVEEISIDGMCGVY